MERQVPNLLALKNILWVYTLLLLQKHEKRNMMMAYQEMSGLWTMSQG
jgi:hypothetical protein